MLQVIERPERVRLVEPKPQLTMHRSMAEAEEFYLRRIEGAAVTAHATGTQTATVTTEHFVSDVNAAGAFVYIVDLNAMADGDVLELRVYQMVLTGGTARLLFCHCFYDAIPSGGDLVAASEVYSNELTDSQACRNSLKQTFGTGRAYPWKVLKHN